MIFFLNYVSIFFSNIQNFILNNLVVVGFYSLVALLVFLYRKKFEIQGIFALYKTKIGINFLDKYGKKYKELIKIFGYMGVGIGFIGMIFISGLLIQSFVKLFTQPSAPPGFAPAIPGVKVPGSPIVIPFWYGIISLFLVTIFHEAAHGLVAKAHGLKIHSTGIAFLGPLFAAFVEPDEEQIEKESDIVQYSIFSAGPFSNILFSVFAVILMILVVSPAYNSMFEVSGYSFNSIIPYESAFNASVPSDTVFTHFNGQKINSHKDFNQELKSLKPNKNITIENRKEDLNFNFKPRLHPEYIKLRDKLKNLTNQNASKKQIQGMMEKIDSVPKVLIGISLDNGDYIQIHKSDELKDPTGINQFFSEALEILYEFLIWFFAISLGVGISNLLPIGPVDGGRMLKLVFQSVMKNENKANDLFSKLSLFIIVLVLFSVVVPIIRAIF